jgi:spoIIIJ-associated protein
MEAIGKAAEALGLERHCFDVEIVEVQRGGLFRKPRVKIRVHTPDSGLPVSGTGARSVSARDTSARDTRGTGTRFTGSANARGDRETRDTRGTGGRSGGNRAGRRDTYDRVPSAAKADAPPLPPPDDPEFEAGVLEYINGIISRMGIEAALRVTARDTRRLDISIESPDSAFLIGKKGRTLDALQLLVNARFGGLHKDSLRVILDCENYRVRREESLVRLALSVADRVRGGRTSFLLEPMNPFDRRVVHTALQDFDDIDTKSEGSGSFKQVRVSYTGNEY